MSIDLLSLAGDASAILERYGFVACGRRVNGRASVDFCTRVASANQHHLPGAAAPVDEVVAACLALVPSATPAESPTSTSDLS